MIATGFCGSYTTFSTYSLEVNKFLEQGNVTFGLIYWLGSVFGGMIALKIGVTLARTGFLRWIIKGAKIDKHLSNFTLSSLAIIKGKLIILTWLLLNLNLSQDLSFSW